MKALTKLICKKNPVILSDTLLHRLGCHDGGRRHSTETHSNAAHNQWRLGQILKLDEEGRVDDRNVVLASVRLLQRQEELVLRKILD